MLSKKIFFYPVPDDARRVVIIITAPNKQGWQYLLMPMKRKAIYQQLVRRYVENKASDREKEVFFHLLAQGKLDKYLHAQMKTKASDVLEKISPGRPLITRPRLAAAAALIGLLLLSGVLWQSYQHHDPGNNAPPVTTYYKNEVPPGGNHAILTLANGSRVMLDSTGKGSLGIQGASRVIKVDASSLSYRAVSNEHTDRSTTYYNTIATPAGGQYQVILADGSKIWLNALSTVKFPTSFHGPLRTVELSGEAYFEVAKDKSKPFHVIANGINIEVLGTSFNVNAYTDEDAIRTTLLEGAVKLTKGNSTLLLAPGQQGQTIADGGLSIARNADADEAVAWKNGYFSFDDADLRTVMRQLSRWYGIQVRYEGKPTRSLFWGKMGRDLKLTQVLSGLDKSKVHFQLEGTTLTVLP